MAHRGVLCRSFPGSSGGPERHRPSAPLIQNPGGGGAGRGTEAVASRGRARLADLEPPALGTRRGRSPPRAPSCPGEPKCATPSPTAPRRPRKPPSSKSAEESPGPSVQAPKAGRRGAPPNTERLASQTAARSRPLWVRRAFWREQEVRARASTALDAGLLAVEPLAGGTEPRLGSVHCKYQRDRKMDSIRRAPRSHKDSSSASGGHSRRPCPREQGSRPRAEAAPRAEFSAPGLLESLPGERVPRKELPVKAEVDGDQPAGERGQSGHLPICLNTSPLRCPNTQERSPEGVPTEQLGRRSGAGRPWSTSPSHPTSSPILTLPPAAAGPSSPKGTQRPMTRCPEPRRQSLVPSPILPLSSQNWGKRRGKHRQGRGPQPVGQRLEMRGRTRPNAPPFALCRCAQVCASLRHKVRGWGAYWGGTGTMPRPPSGPEGGSPKPPHVSALQSLPPGRAKNPHPHPELWSPATAPLPALGLLHPKKTRDGEAGGGRGRGAAPRQRQVH